MTCSFSAEQIASLSAPLDRAKVRQREQGRSKVSYLEGWQVIAEANRIFGFDGWLHPGWQVQWLDHRCGAIEAIAELPELVRQSCLCVGNAAVRGDLLRLALLWLHGGVAVDFRIAALQSLEPLLADQELLLLQDGTGGIDNGVWAAPARHPWVEAVLIEGCRNVIGAQGYNRWALTGSCLLSGVTARWLRPQLAGKPPQWPALTVLALSEQRHWLKNWMPEPAPDGFVAPAAAPLLNRRRCSWLRQRWGQDLPTLRGYLNTPSTGSGNQ